MTALGYLSKLKRGLGLAFGAHFLHDFSKKCLLFNTLSMDKLSMSYLFHFSRHQQNVSLSSYLDNYDIITMTVREKREKHRNTKI